MPTAISAPPLTPQPSWSGTLQRRSGAWPAARSMSAVGADVVKTLPISSPIWTMMTRPDRRRRAAPMPIGRVESSGFLSPTRRLSPRTSMAASLTRPALMAVTMVSSVARYFGPAW